MFSYDSETTARSSFWQSQLGSNLSVCGIAGALHCTYRLGLELGVDLVQAGVEASEGADVLLILPGHLLGFTLLDWDGRERTGGSAWGYFFWFETVGTKRVGPEDLRRCGSN